MAPVAQAAIKAPASRPRVVRKIIPFSFWTEWAGRHRVLDVLASRRPIAG
jgi:hypothetical protein